MSTKTVEQQDLKRGTTYDIRGTRKGNFRGTLLTDPTDREFATFRITSGKARFMSGEDRGKGQTVEMRLSFCEFYHITVPETEERN